MGGLTQCHKGHQIHVLPTVFQFVIFQLWTVFSGLTIFCMSVCLSPSGAPLLFSKRPMKLQINIIPLAGKCLYSKLYSSCLMFFSSGQCILQDGPSPHFLSKALAERIVSGNPQHAAEKEMAEGLAKTGVLSVSAL